MLTDNSLNYASLQAFDRAEERPARISEMEQLQELAPYEDYGVAVICESMAAFVYSVQFS